VTTLALTVRKVWPGSQGGAVFTGLDDSGALHRVVAAPKALHRIPLAGEHWEVEGPIRAHYKFGPQIHAEWAVPVRPQGEVLRRFLAQNPNFQQIGETRARRLWEVFGEDLPSLLDTGNNPLLADILGDKLATSLIEAWRLSRGETRAVRWLDEHKFPVSLATKALRLWGVDAAEKIAENPYRLLAIADWPLVDAAALDAGASPYSPERLVAAVEATCYRVLHDKHTVVSEGDLLAGVQTLLRCPIQTAQEAISTAEAESAVVKLSPGHWQPFGPWVMESFLRDQLRERARGEGTQTADLYWARPGDDQIGLLTTNFESREGIHLTEEQRHAVWLAMTQRCSLIMGGAGTGKTSIIRAVRHVQEASGGSILGVALAGRAAQRLREIGCQARTLAGLLGALERQEISLSGADLVVLDEASMVDLPLAYTLFRHLPPETRLLMVGDPYQLPPIGFGLVFGALVNDPSIPKVELTRIHRQAQSTGIPSVARQIRDGKLPSLPPFSGPGPGVSFIHCRVEEAQATIIETLGALGSETQLLSPIKRGLAGTEAINTSIHALRSTGQTWSGLGLGDPVIHLENDYESLVFNGTLGTVSEVLADGVQIQWDGHDHPMTFRESRREALALAYAISIHKAQGSQFRRVVIPIFTNRLLDRTLVYTALTRAEEQVVFLGDWCALEAAVKAQPAPEQRRTGMMLAADSACFESPI